MDVDPDPPVPVSISRAGRQRKFPKHYVDFLPSMPSSLPHIPSKAPAVRNARAVPCQPSPEPSPEPEAPAIQPVRTEPNDLGLYRVYVTPPSSDPTDIVSLDSLCDSPNLATATAAAPRNILSSLGITSLTQPIIDSFAPFLNITVFRLVSWWYNGSSMKSAAEIDRLINDVLTQDDFDKSHLLGVRAATEAARLDKYETEKKKDGTFTSADGWTESSVKIRLPAKEVKYSNETLAPSFEVPGIFHRDITNIIKSAYEDDISLTFNMTPYEEFVEQSPGEPPMRVYGETYTADAHIQLHKDVQEPRPPGNTMERVVAAITLQTLATLLCGRAI
jgi:hypothetical protein